MVSNAKRADHSVTQWFVWTALCFWFGLALSGLGVWLHGRFGKGLAGQTISPLAVAADLLFILLIAALLLHAAHRWQRRRLGIAAVGMRVALGGLFFAVLLLSGIALRQMVVGPEMFLAELLAAYAAGGMAFDLSLYWLLAASLVPLPFLREWAASTVRPSQPDPPMLLVGGANSPLRTVMMEDIWLVQAAGNYVEICTDQGRLLHRATLTAILADLAPLGFVRLSRAAAVRIDHVVRIDRGRGRRWTATLRDGTALTVSRRWRIPLHDGLAGRSSLP
jgi:hypothetical protein